MRVIERPVRIRALSIARARGIRAMCTGCFTARAHPSPRDVRIRNYKTGMYNRISDRCFVFSDWLHGAMYNPTFLLLTYGTSSNQARNDLRRYVSLELKFTFSTRIRNKIFSTNRFPKTLRFREYIFLN